jgi:putative transposase
MLKSLRIRLLPTQDQENLLWKHVHASRFIWNWCLNYQQELYKNEAKHLSGYSMRNVVTQLKKEENFSWLNEVSAQTINETILDLDLAYKFFYRKLFQLPKFKSRKRSEPKFPVRCDCIYFINNTVHVEKIGKIKYKTNYSLPQGRGSYKFKNPRIKFANGKWILSISMEFENQKRILSDYNMGIDLGIKELAVVAFGEKRFVFHNINKTKKVKRLKSKLLHLCRKQAKKYTTNNKNKRYPEQYYKSNRILQVEKQIKKIYARLSNIRRNYIHQCTSFLTKLYPKQVIMETLNLIGMYKNKHLSGALQEQCLSMFIRQMKYKCEWNDIEFIQVDRFYPSSKTCSSCGCIKSDLKLKDRTFQCEHCGLVIDRDENAAINLMKYSVA